jgi:hypothetical protein
MEKIKQVRAFLQKSAAKNFWKLGHVRASAVAKDQKFFGSFFQKGTASVFKESTR